MAHRAKRTIDPDTLEPRPFSTGRSRRFARTTGRVTIDDATAEELDAPGRRFAHRG